MVRAGVRLAGRRIVYARELTRAYAPCVPQETDQAWKRKVCQVHVFVGESRLVFGRDVPKRSWTTFSAKVYAEHLGVGVTAQLGACMTTCANGKVHMVRYSGRSGWCVGWAKIGLVR